MKGNREIEIQSILGSESCFYLDPNNFEDTKTILTKFKNVKFSIFDTFVAEEFFSHYIHRFHPECIKLLDSQDLHSLRMARQKVIENQNFGFFEENLKSVVNTEPDLFSHPEDNTKHIREISSIYRSDHTFVVSDFEKNLLSKNYKLSKNTSMLPFFYPKDTISQNKIDADTLNQSYNRRKHYVWIGNFQHPPNYQAAKILISEIFPKISKKIEELHIYGANFPKDIARQCKDDKSNRIKA